MIGGIETEFAERNLQMTRLLAAAALAATLALPASAAGIAPEPVAIVEDTTNAAAPLLVPVLFLVFLAAAVLD